MAEYIKLNERGLIEEVKSIEQYFGASDIYSQDYYQKLSNYFNGIISDFSEIINSLNSKYASNTTIKVDEENSFSIVDKTTLEKIMTVSVDEDGVPFVEYHSDLRANSIKGVSNLSISNLEADKITSNETWLGNFVVTKNGVKYQETEIFDISSTEISLKNLNVENNLVVNGTFEATLPENILENDEIKLGGITFSKKNGKMLTSISGDITSQNDVYLYEKTEGSQAVKRSEFEEFETKCNERIETFYRNLEKYFEEYNIEYVVVSVTDIEKNERGSLSYNARRDYNFYPNFSDNKFEIELNKDGANRLLYNFKVEVDKGNASLEEVYLLGFTIFNSEMNPDSFVESEVSDVFSSGLVKIPLKITSDFNGGYITLDEILSKVDGAEKLDGLLYFSCTLEVIRKDGKHLTLEIVIRS